MKIEIMDTTLRDGEQTHGISFTPLEKQHLAALLIKDVGVDRIEIASARVSAGELDAAKKIVQWARKTGNLEKIEILGFVDGSKSLDWIEKAGAMTLNLLCKGSLNHVKKQLGKSPQDHLSDIKNVIRSAEKRKFQVNIYLEDWSNGMRNSEDYVLFMIDGLKNEKIERLMLPDTLGILNQDETYQFCKKIVEQYPDLHIDFHAHNDYDLAIANVYSAVKAGVSGIHTTVNGLGERAGNAPLSSVLCILNDHLKIETKLNETEIIKASKLVESFSGIRIPDNKPVIGEHVFTQTAGVHADGDKKDNLYCNDLLPERFGRKRKYALGKLSGKANIEKNLEALGLNLSVISLGRVTKRIIELGDKKKNVTTEDLPFIIADVLDNGINYKKNIVIKNYTLSLSKDMRPLASIQVEIDGAVYEETSVGDGQYDAFMKALWKIYNQLNRDKPVLIDYQVSIPPGGNTNALVETKITWEFAGKEFITRGLDADQTEAAIKATEKSLNILENQKIFDFTINNEDEGV